VSAPNTTPLLGTARDVGRLLSVSETSVRRIIRTNPAFPQPIRLTPNSDLRWPLDAVRAFVAAQNDRPAAA
jgi:predicted DNA-binding transcriptional regulator AlpA